MTSIHIYDPATRRPALPDLPPLPIGALAVGLANLLQEAADLPAAALHHHVRHAAHQRAIRQDPASARPHPLGAAVRQRHHHPAPPGHDRPRDLVPHRSSPTTASTVSAYAHIPASPAHL